MTTFDDKNMIYEDIFILPLLNQILFPAWFILSEYEENSDIQLILIDCWSQKLQVKSFSLSVVPFGQD